jgi:tetratricopeptide (TPR) repeat protein
MPVSLSLVAAVLVSLFPSCPPHEGKHEQIEAATEAIEAAPADVALRLKRAEVFLVHEELADCAADLAFARELAGDSLQVVLMDARLQFALGAYLESLASADVVLAAAPGAADRLLAMQLRADDLTRLARTETAIAAWSALLEAHPDPRPDWYLQRASLQAVLAEGGIETALVGLDEGIRRLGPVVVSCYARPNSRSSSAVPMPR